MVRKNLVIHPRDNVAVLLEDAHCGDSILHDGKEIGLKEDIPFAHKAALCGLAKGQPVYKYGEEIGFMLADVPEGTWIHDHNMGCNRGK